MTDNIKIVKDIVDYDTYLIYSEKLLKHYVDICDYKRAFYMLINILSHFPMFKRFSECFQEQSPFK